MITLHDINRQAHEKAWQECMGKDVVIENAPEQLAPKTMVYRQELIKQALCGPMGRLNAS